MRLVVGSDHAGWSLKSSVVAHIKSLGHEVVDAGSYDDKPVDVPDIARKVCAMVTSREADRGIMVCGTGVGASIAANKVRGIRAAMCLNETLARYSREHNGANVLTLGATLLTPDEAVAIVLRVIETPMREPRYIARLEKIARLENS